MSKAKSEQREQIVLRVATATKRAAVAAAKKAGLSLNAYSEKRLLGQRIQ
jgi:predicted HicB family RNase H-like nuclease